MRIYLSELYPPKFCLSPFEYPKENSSSTSLEVSPLHSDPLLYYGYFSFRLLNVSPTCISLYLHIVCHIVHAQIYEFVTTSHEQRLDKSNEEA